MKRFAIALIAAAGCAAEAPPAPYTGGAVAAPQTPAQALTDGQACPKGAYRAVSAPGAKQEVEACYILVDGGTWLLHGPRVAWHKNGLQAARQNYWFGSLHGTQTGWTEKGLETHRVCYVQGAEAHKGDCTAEELKI